MGILIKTFSLALKQYPKLNSLYHSAKSPYEYDIYSSHNISIAIDSPNGLVVPHIKNVSSLNLVQIQQ
jgi:2-oxoisovalerate dehydrogenase E2 component (dihydrolipoyl transacylase)